jgi:hypothetical protein
MSEDAITNDESASREEPRDAATCRRRCALAKIARGPVLALLGGTIAWVALDLSYPISSVPPELINSGPNQTAEDVAKYAAAEKEAFRHNWVFALAVLGAAMGGLLGLGEGAARGSLKTALAGACLTAVAGVLFGSLAGLAGHTLFVTAKAAGLPLTLAQTVLAQGAVLGTLGGGIGLAIGLTHGRARSTGVCLIAGLGLGVLAALLFSVVVALAIPGEQTEWPVPLTSGGRLLWIAVAAVMLGTFLPVMASHRPGDGAKADDTRR